MAEPRFIRLLRSVSAGGAHFPAGDYDLLNLNPNSDLASERDIAGDKFRAFVLADSKNEHQKGPYCLQGDGRGAFWPWGQDGPTPPPPGEEVTVKRSREKATA